MLISVSEITTYQHGIYHGICLYRKVREKTKHLDSPLADLIPRRMQQTSKLLPAWLIVMSKLGCLCAFFLLRS